MKSWWMGGAGQGRAVRLILASGFGAWVLGADLGILPSPSVMVSGETQGFRAQGLDPEGGPWSWSVLEPGGGRVDPDAGTYVAPPVEQPRVFHLQLRPRGEATPMGATTVTVLPRALFTGLGPQGEFTYPFLIPGTRRRFGEDFQVQSWSPQGAGQPCERKLVGYGLPVTLAWATTPGTARELLSYREGEALHCQDVTGRGSVTLRPRARISGCMLEALTRPGPGSPAWKSFQRTFCIGVRGLLPFGPACGEEPVGLALLGGGLHAPARFVVADAARHRILTLSREGELEGGWGGDGQSGHRDGGPAEARFCHPTFLAVNQWFKKPMPYQYSYAFVVADTGNQVIRQVDDHGEVRTLAGTVGQAGYRDADQPRQALFNQPQGLVMDREGTVRVADQGNHVLRSISREGQVTTLAGLGGTPGTRDGVGLQARFQHLVGLTLAQDDHLYVVDGHAIRRVTREGAVTTVLGQVDGPGFRDGPGDLAGVPCLREPSGLVAASHYLLIADMGNHAVRAFDLSTGALLTLAGDPAEAQLRFGLLRDGIAGPLDDAFGALRLPRAVAVCEAGDLYVTTGPGLARLARQRIPEGPGPGPELRVEADSVAPGQAFNVAFSVPTRKGTEASRPIQFVLEFRNGDGTLAERQEGSGLGDRSLACTGRLTRPGPGTVRLRAVTDQGYVQAARVQVTVSGPWPP